MIPSVEYAKEIQRYTQNNQDLLRVLHRQTLLITGAAGLIGSYLVDLLMCFNRQFHGAIRIVAVDNNAEAMTKRFSCYDCDEFFTALVYDITQPLDLLAKLPIDYIIHAASHTSPLNYAQDPVGSIMANVIGSRLLLDYCRIKHVKRFLFCSSVEAYGRNNGDIDAFTEDYSGYVDCNTPRAAYPSAKRLSESMCSAYHSQYGVDYVIGRIGRIFGATVYLNDAKASTQFIMNAVHGENIIMKSDGMQEFSYGYVGDCVTALLTILLKGETTQAYNIADPCGAIHLRDFSGFAAEFAGTQLQLEPQSALEQKSYSKITKATMAMDKLIALGWHPTTSVKAGIAQTITQIKEILEG